MIDTSGFYKIDDNDIFYWAPNMVRAPDYSLDRETKDIIEYPYNGWYWFESRQEALDFFNVEEPDDLSTIYDPFVVIRK
jgi:hypothetical protein